MNRSFQFFMKTNIKRFKKNNASDSAIDHDKLRVIE